MGERARREGAGRNLGCWVDHVAEKRKSRKMDLKAGGIG
jgi:hypothetical protein